MPYLNVKCFSLLISGVNMGKLILPRNDLEVLGQRQIHAHCLIPKGIFKNFVLTISSSNGIPESYTAVPVIFPHLYNSYLL